MSDLSILADARELKNNSSVTSNPSRYISDIADNISAVEQTHEIPSSSMAKSVGEKSWQDITLSKRVVIDGLIDKYQCKSKPALMANLCVENKNELKRQGISYQMLSFRSNVSENTVRALITIQARKSVINKKDLTLEQQSLLLKIAPQKELFSKASSLASLWLNNIASFTAVGLARDQLAKYCGVDMVRLRVSVSKIIASERKLGNVSVDEKFINRLIISNGCIRNADYAATTWLDNEEKLNELAVSVEDFSIKCKLKSDAVVKAISQRVVLKNSATDQQVLLLKKVISDANCVGDVNKSSHTWLEKKLEFEGAEITKTLFSSFCGLNTITLSKRIRLIRSAQVVNTPVIESWLRENIDEKNCNGNVNAVIKFWHENKNFLENNDISLQHLGVRCNINNLTLDRVFYEDSKHSNTFADEQKSLVTEIIKNSDATGDIEKTLAAFFNNLDKLLAAKVTSDIFAHYSDLNTKVLNGRINKQRKENKKIEIKKQRDPSKETVTARQALSKQERDWNGLTSVNKNLINNIILKGGCAGDSVKSAIAWIDYRSVFREQCVKQELFAFKCNFTTRELRNAVNLFNMSIKGERLLTSRQKLLFDEIDKNYLCEDNCAIAAEVWTKYAEQFESANIKRSFFSTYYKIPLDSLSHRVKVKGDSFFCNRENEMYLKEMIDNSGCRGHLQLSVKIWFENKKELAARGVKLAQLAGKCEVNFASMRKVIFYLDQEKIKINVKQQDLLSRLSLGGNAGHSLSKRDLTQFSILWLDNQPALMTAGVKLGTFARYFGINSFSLMRRVSLQKNARLTLNEKQKKVFDQILQHKTFTGDIEEIICIWLKHEKLIKSVKINFFTFVAKCNVNPTSTHVKKMMLERQARVVLIPRQKSLLANITERYRCQGNIDTSVSAWFSEASSLRAFDISQAVFSRYCNVDINKFSESVKFKKSIKDIPSLKQQAIKVEPQDCGQGVPEIVLDSNGDSIKVDISDTLRVGDGYIINNSFPIIRAQDVSTESITLSTLGLQSVADLKDIRITHWGAMHGTFLKMSTSAVIALKKKLILEIRRQIADETGQAMRMATLMVGCESHRQALEGDQIINLGTGVINPGKSAVPANTVLGLYAGVLQDDEARKQANRKRGVASTFSHCWSTQKNTLAVDAFLSGNILRNVNTGCLPGSPQLAVNNVAAVQVKSRLMAYITLTEIAPGEEYFVDYGKTYNPNESVMLAKQKERLLKHYTDNKSSLDTLGISPQQFASHYDCDLQGDIEAIHGTTSYQGGVKKMSRAVKTWFMQHPLNQIVIKQEPSELSERTTPKLIFSTSVNNLPQLEDAQGSHSNPVVKPISSVMSPTFAPVSMLFPETPQPTHLQSATPEQLAKYYGILLHAASLATLSLERAAQFMQLNMTLGSQLASIKGYQAPVDRALTVYFALLQQLLDGGTLTAQQIYAHILDEKGGGVSAATRALTRVKSLKYPVTSNMVKLLTAAGVQVGSHQVFRTFLETPKIDPAHPQLMMQRARDGINRLKHAAVEDWLSHSDTLSPSAMAVCKMLDAANLLPLNSELARRSKAQTREAGVEIAQQEAGVQGRRVTMQSLYNQLLGAMREVKQEVMAEYARWERLDNAAAAAAVAPILLAQSTAPQHRVLDLFASLAEVRTDLWQANYASTTSTQQKDLRFEQQQIRRRSAMNSPQTQRYAANLIPALFDQMMARSHAIPNAKTESVRDNLYQQEHEIARQLSDLNLVDRALAQLNESDDKTASIEKMLARFREQNLSISTTTGPQQRRRAEVDPANFLK